MPTIEIASINAAQLDLKQADFEVAIIEENKLESHRGLFNYILQEHDGSIIHIGNPEFKQQNNGIFFAGDIIDWDVNTAADYIIIPNADDTGANQQDIFKFLDKFRQDIDRLLRIALDKSPTKRVFFLTDYQFGPEKEQTEILYTINDFWEKHDTEGLRFNKLYEMYGI